MDSDIILNKLIKYVTVSWHDPMTTRNISSTMYLIMCLPDLPLAIFQQDRYLPLELLK